MKRSLALVGVATLATGAFAQSFYEGFDDITNLPGWSMINNSDLPANNWFQGNSTVFPANSGAANSYIGANYQFTTGVAATGFTINAWLLTPTRMLNNGDTFSFFTRTVDGSIFPDRLQLRMSTNGSSSNVGAGAEGVGDFSNLLIDINAGEALGGYPETWTMYQATVSGLGGPTSGRFALRYYIHNAGPIGDNSNYIGVDDARYSSVVPEPASLAVLGLGALALIRRRR